MSVQPASAEGWVFFSLQPNGPIDVKPDKACRLLGRTGYRPRQAKTAEAKKHQGHRGKEKDHS